MFDLRSRATAGASVNETTPGIWRLSIPSGPPGIYRWAQMDDYLHEKRADFHWLPPVQLVLNARVSESEHNGTWGFGFWNDPFNLSLGVAGTSRRLPELPNASWFFFASPANYLSFRDDQPANGMLAGVFSSPQIPPILLAPGAFLLPLMLTRFTTSLLRSILRTLIREHANQTTLDWTEWHRFSVTWTMNELVFGLDGNTILSTSIVPRGRLGLVIWIDNQYARLAPSERFRSGTLANPRSCWLDVKDLSVSRL